MSEEHELTFEGQRRLESKRKHGERVAELTQFMKDRIAEALQPLFLETNTERLRQQVQGLVSNSVMAAYKEAGFFDRTPELEIEQDPNEPTRINITIPPKTLVGLYAGQIRALMVPVGVNVPDCAVAKLGVDEETGEDKLLFEWSEIEFTIPPEKEDPQCLTQE